MNLVKIIGASSGIGADDSRCAEGPVHIKNNLKQFGEPFSRFTWHATLHSHSLSEPIENIADFCLRLAQQTYILTYHNQKFVILGGDHSCAIGTWSGIAAATKDQGELGLVWIDAHMDAHTPKTTESGNIHGMPIAVLLGAGDWRLTNILSFAPKIKPKNICLIGVRSYELEESKFLQALGVKIYFIEEVLKRGISNVINEAVQYVKQSTIGYGISIDLDAFDPIQVPGTGLPVNNGINVEEFLASLVCLSQDQKLFATEIVEYNPYFDINNKTAKVILQILNTIYK